MAVWKTISFILMATTGLAVLAVILVSVLLSQDNSDEVCTSKACISAAQTILKNMDPNADPCEDFNQFACGSFLRESRIPDDQTGLDSFGDLRTTLAFRVSDQLESPISASEPEATRNAKRLYSSCKNEANIEAVGQAQFVRALNEEYDGWPLLSASYSASKTPVAKLIDYRKRGLRPIVNVFVTSNPKNPAQYTIAIDQPSWFFSKQYYNDSNVVAAYKEYITRVAEFMGAGTSNPSRYRSDIEDMYKLETEFVQLLLTEEEKRDLSYAEMTISELQQKMPAFEWKTMIDSFFEGITTIADTEKIVVYDLKYLEPAARLFEEASRTRRVALDNLMAWSFIKDRSTYLPKRYKDARLDFDKVYIGQTTLAPRSRTCANAALDRMPYAVGRLYVEKYFNEDSKNQALEMIQNIRSEFREILKSEVDWMDEASKTKADEKAVAIDVKIGYPEFTFNDTHLNDIYKGYTFTADNFINNNVEAMKSDATEMFHLLRKTRNLKDWFSGPAVVNAFYEPELNQICFPAGILQAPFYDVNAPKYLNYGGIGVVIGHEVTHGFDDQGRLYDKDGILIPDNAPGSWSNSTIENYKKRATCIVNQYSSYVAKQVGLNLNGAQTQGENIADNGGIRESFKAYKRWVKKNGKEAKLPGLDYTPEQLFFINHGQVWCSKYRDETLRQRIRTGVHSPGEFRIRGPTSNYDEFAKAFKCKAKTGNNPENKCIVW